MLRTKNVTFKGMATDNSLWKAFGKWLQDEREKTGVTQDDVAKETGLNSKSISRIERGEGGTKRSTIITIVEAVNKLSHGYQINVSEALRRAGFVAEGLFSDSVQTIANRLATGVMASGFNDLEDEDLREAFFDDMQTIAESMVKRKLEEQRKRNSKNN